MVRSVGKSKRRSGFTIIELLIVIVVIAILAAITIAVFNGITSKAQETSVKNDMRNIAKQLELYNVEGGRYPTATDLQTLGIRVNKITYGVNPTGATIFYCVDDAGTTFSIVARVKSLTLLQYLSTSNQTSIYSGSTTAPQLCLDSGVPGTTATVTYTAFTSNGAWYPWVN